MLIGATKGKIWEHEKEVRIVIDADSFDPNKYKHINNKQNILVDFDPTCISKIIFGIKSTTEEIEKIVKVFCDIGYLPEFTRLDIDPLTLNVIEKNTGHRAAVLEYNDLLQPTAGSGD